MKINHLNLTVNDVEGAKIFLNNYFDLEITLDLGKSLVAMTNEDGFLLNLMHGKDITYPKTFHVGFQQETKEQVDELNERLKADRFEVEDPTFTHGSYTFYLQAPGDFTIEVFCQIEGADPTQGPTPTFGRSKKSSQ